MAIVPVSSVILGNNKRIGYKSSSIKPNELSYFSTPNLVFGEALKEQSLYRLNSRKVNAISFTGYAFIPGQFKEVAMTEKNPNWETGTTRLEELYKKSTELRSEFSRDYDRILHSASYKRLTGKTQVFIIPNSDTTCTRNLHVNQVASISETISDFLGLNSKLTRAIAIGHDLGHTPFGHSGEVTLNNLMIENNLKGGFWHEKNSLRFIDDIETKPDPNGFERNLNLTYAVRDGIICHCGEIVENHIKPRTEHIDLKSIQKTSKMLSSTWEGCVVRISDNIAYLGTDIDDAINNKFLHPSKKLELIKQIKDSTGVELSDVNSTVLMDKFVSDLCANSNPKEGLKFSEETYQIYKIVKKFNRENIYSKIDDIQTPYVDLVLKTIFNDLARQYEGKNTLDNLEKIQKIKPTMVTGFSDWLVKYSDIAPEERSAKKYANKIIYSIDDPDDYKLAVIEYISSLTDRSATKAYNEIVFRG